MLPKTWNDKITRLTRGMTRTYGEHRQEQVLQVVQAMLGLDCSAGRIGTFWSLLMSVLSRVIGFRDGLHRCAVWRYAGGSTSLQVSAFILFRLEAHAADFAIEEAVLRFTMSAGRGQYEFIIGVGHSTYSSMLMCCLVTEHPGTKQE
jgi:hypothetical protein